MGFCFLCATDHPVSSLLRISILSSWTALKFCISIPISKQGTMPRRPHSCAVCQARKVKVRKRGDLSTYRRFELVMAKSEKCDRTKPACMQCTKYGWTCPGFVSESIRARRRNSELKPGRSTFLSGVDIFLPSQFLGSLVARELVSLLALTIPQGRSLSELGGFIHLVPARLGLNDALDASVQCLCSAYSSFLASNVLEDKTHYSRALKSLRQSIANEETALSSEVLCAVVCLSWYEVGLENDCYRHEVASDGASGPSEPP